MNNLERTPALKSVKSGDELLVLRQTRLSTGKDLFLRRNRKLYVLCVLSDVALIVLHKPLKGILGEVSTETFEFEGFKWCLLIDTKLLLENCRRV